MSALTARFDAVCERLEKALAESGRSAEDLRLVAVSKNHEAAVVAELARHWSSRAVPLFGESYLQEALPKMEQVGSLTEGMPVRWHFIGHLQSRKARDVAGRFALIHSVDSLKLAAALQKAWHNRVAGEPRSLDAPAPPPQDILLQVNVGREPQKSGVFPDKLEDLAAGVLNMPELRLRGLMCIPPLAEIGEDSRPYFSMLRTLRDNLEGSFGIRLPELSMGMSDDFFVAVAEGASLVRIGTDIFGPRH
ncbi:YggS family pyridoxal phosphate-dependent enzyme [Desulfovibrio sp. OttesenSCG-928-A18]|nr:YggS family pyridoxal phosphate-dependent enzyme [Desulfovibrio sp. OttesenSCG-928-A18]